MNSSFEIMKKAFELHGFTSEYLGQVFTALQIGEEDTDEAIKAKFTPEVLSQMNIDEVLWSSIVNSAIQVAKVSSDAGKIYSAQTSPPIQSETKPKKESKAKASGEPSAPREVQPDISLPVTLNPALQTKISPQDFIASCQHLQANGNEVNYQSLEETYQWKKGVVDSTVSKMSGLTFPKFVKNQVWVEGNFIWA